MDPDLLEFICCPETHQPLHFATKDELTRLSSSIPFEAALLREDGRVAYPIREGIPILLIEEQLLVG